MVKISQCIKNRLVCFINQTQVTFRGRIPGESFYVLPGTIGQIAAVNLKLKYVIIQILARDRGVLVTAEVVIYADKYIRGASLPRLSAIRLVPPPELKVIKPESRRRR